VFVGLGCGDKNSPKNFEFEHHDAPTVFFHIPVIGIFSRIGNEFDLARLVMYEHAITGGGASLTPFGAELLERYNRILNRAATNAVDDLAALARRASPDAGPKV
jgi:hypothetical protein